MNLVFLLKTGEIGGIGIVTARLANKFVQEGHEVVFVSFNRPPEVMLNKLDKRILTFQLGKYEISKSIIRRFRKILIENKIDFILNQMGLPYIPIIVAKKASKGLNVKIITTYHNSPNYNGRVQHVKNQMIGKTGLILLFYKLKKYLYMKVTSTAMKYNYKQSDRFIVLSNSYVEEFKSFTKIGDVPKLRVLNNPVMLDNKKRLNFEAINKSKEKEIIYVGRLDGIQKCVFRVLDTWNIFKKKHPEWNLFIVGDGEERCNLERKANMMKLKDVFFVGYQNPLDYYKRARLLLLTSDFEGFPLVLVEAMSYGVIPVVYDSFSALNDIIDNGKDGIIVSKVSQSFSPEEMFKGMELALYGDTLLQNMSSNAMEKSHNYELDKIYNDWLALFNEFHI